MNKYEKWYNNIIKNAKTRNLEAYSERHHIIPKSLGGSDSQSNLVKLTAKEHFICHWLLVKIHKGDAKGKMINALYMMQGKSIHQKRYISKITGRIYENLRKEYSEYIKKQNLGNQINQEQREKIRQSKLGKKRNPFSKEWLEKIKKLRQGEKNGMFGKKHSEEAKKKQSIKALGRKQSPETIAKKSLAIKGSKRKKIICPHCQQYISVNTYPRWHGDNCKFKK